MPSFNISSPPRQVWQLELQGSDDVQFNGALMEEAYAQMADCAERSGCMEDGQLTVNETCVETYERYLAPNGLGMRVRPAAAQVAATRKRATKKEATQQEGE